MKIICRLQFIAKEAGATDEDPDRTPDEIVREWHESYPHLRFCKRLRAWVYKKHCVKCPQCLRVIEE